MKMAEDQSMKFNLGLSDSMALHLAPAAEGLSKEVHRATLALGRQGGYLGG